MSGLSTHWTRGRTHPKTQETAQLAGRSVQRNWNSVRWGKKYFVLFRLEQPRQNKNLLYEHNKPNEPTKEGPLSFVLFESPFTSAEAVDMNGRFQMQGGKNWFLPKEMNANSSSGTLIGWKSGQTTFIPLWDRMEGAWLWIQRPSFSILSGPTCVLPQPRKDFSMFSPISHRQEPAIKISLRANY